MHTIPDLLEEEEEDVFGFVAGALKEGAAVIPIDAKKSTSLLLLLLLLAPPGRGSACIGDLALFDVLLLLLLLLQKNKKMKIK